MRLVRRGHDAALQQFKYALELAQRGRGQTAGERPEYHYHMGLALKQLGRNDEATTAFERALASQLADEKALELLVAQAKVEETTDS